MTKFEGRKKEQEKSWRKTAIIVNCSPGTFDNELFDEDQWQAGAKEIDEAEAFCLRHKEKLSFLKQSLKPCSNNWKV